MGRPEYTKPIIGFIATNHKDIYALSLWQVGIHVISNGVKGVYEITKNDIRNIIAESGKDIFIRSLRGILVPNIMYFLVNGEYIGWSLPDCGSHNETSYFAYFRIDSEYLAMRYMKTEKRFKPYTFYSHENFKKYREATIQKEIPTIWPTSQI